MFCSLWQTSLLLKKRNKNCEIDQKLLENSQISWDFEKKVDEVSKRIYKLIFEHLENNLISSTTKLVAQNPLGWTIEKIRYKNPWTSNL